jgi:hypothetical protein
MTGLAVKGLARSGVKVWGAGKAVVRLRTGGKDDVGLAQDNRASKIQPRMDANGREYLEFQATWMGLSHGWSRNAVALGLGGRRGKAEILLRFLWKAHLVHGQGAGGGPITRLRTFSQKLMKDALNL